MRMRSKSSSWCAWMKIHFAGSTCFRLEQANDLAARDALARVRPDRQAGRPARDRRGGHVTCVSASGFGKDRGLDESGPDVGPLDPVLPLVDPLRGELLRVDLERLAPGGTAPCTDRCSSRTASRSAPRARAARARRARGTWGCSRRRLRTPAATISSTKGASSRRPRRGCTDAARRSPRPPKSTTTCSCGSVNAESLASISP